MRTSSLKIRAGVRLLSLLIAVSTVATASALNSFASFSPVAEKEAPLSLDQAMSMLQAHVPSSQIEKFARDDGIDFQMTSEIERGLRKAGATERLILLLKRQSASTKAAPRPAAEPGNAAGAALREADEALARKDYSAAVQALNTVLAKQPDLAPAWFDLGFAYNGLHQSDEAEKAYRQAVELSPDNFLAQLNLGILLLEQNHPQTSAEHLQKAVALKPENPRAHLYCGRALAAIDQADGARQEFQKASRLDPHSAAVQFEMGQFELKQQQPAAALAGFEKALLIDPQFAPAELGATAAAESANNLVQAQEHLERYLVLKPNDAGARLRLGRLYLKQNDYQRARATFESMYQTQPDLPGLAAELGDVNAKLKHFKDAESYYRLAIEKNPDDADLHRALGQIHLNQQKYLDAEKEFRTALQLDARNREAAIGLAFSLNFEQRYQEAIPIFEQVAKLPDIDVSVFFVLATCYDQLHALKPALANYEHFLQVSNSKHPDQEWQATQRAKLLRRELSK